MAAASRLRSLPGRVLRRVVPKPPDPPREWRGIDRPGFERARLVRFGDCSWREIDFGHGRGSRAGFPLAAAELLERRGVALSFGDVYTAGVEPLPARAEDMDRYVRLHGDPDFIVLQPALSHAIRSIFTPRDEWNRVRDLAGRRAGPLARLGYVVIQPALRRFGSLPGPFPGTAPVEAFIRAARERWPDVEIVAVSPWRPLHDGWVDPAQLEAVWREVAECCRREGVEVIDCADAVDRARSEHGTRAVNGANGYDLRRAGHEAVGALLAEWIAARLPSQRDPAAR